MSYELYHELTEAFSNQNLNQITGKLILLYKNKNYNKIREIANKVSRYIPIEEDIDAKCFSRLIILFHPDKGEQIRNAIRSHFEKNDAESLKKFSYIFVGDEIDQIKAVTIDRDIDYDPDYVWDISNDGFGFEDENEEDHFEDTDFERSFYNLIKIREYGSVSIEFPTYYLEDFEDFEMAESGLETLDGVEYCKHVKILDISNNLISDIGNLWTLDKLEELYMSNNQIGYIDALNNLANLKTLDISGNRIDDISPLFDLPKLEYVNLIGNPVKKEQVKTLEDKEVIVTI